LDTARSGAAATLPARVRAVVRGLRTPGRRATASESVLRALTVTGLPDGIAGRLVDLAFDWFGGEGWATLGQAEGRGLAWLGDRGIASTRRSAITSLANRVVESGQPAWSGDVSQLGPTRLRARFGALALPLRSESRVVGVLVGTEGPPDGDRRAKLELRPAPGGDGRGANQLVRDISDLDPLWLLLDPMAAALHAAMRLSRAEKLSSIDDLTGLYNSRFLAGALQREAKRALRSNRPLSVLFVDLDGFKGINDRWGHLNGSRALVEAAARIASGARETDVVSRYGGDEFAIVLPETPPEGAMIVARRVRERIADHAFLKEDDIGYRLTASVGVATLPDAARTPEDLLAAADAAMYRVKARGKDGIETASPDVKGGKP
jgi:diguanylate cyclase (GGDEF)-like protein